MKWNRFLFTSLIVMIIFVLTACGGTSTNKATTEEKAMEETTEQAVEETAEVTDLILATTTSTQDSGLLDELLPIFQEKYPYNVKTIAVGTGQALEMGVKGEADVLLTHAPASEQELVDNGDVMNYKKVMYNDYIIVGPENDPAGIKGLDVTEAFPKLVENNAIFVSRGDDSGTHKKELQVWKAAGFEIPEGSDKPDQDYFNNTEAYVQTGDGMGDTLRVAGEKLGYVLTDRATYLAQKENYPDLTIVVEGSEDLKNIYHVMQVDPEKNDMINSEGAKNFVEFMVDEETQNIIAEFGMEEYGEPLFYKDAE